MRSTALVVSALFFSSATVSSVSTVYCLGRSFLRFHISERVGLFLFMFLMGGDNIIVWSLLVS